MVVVFCSNDTEATKLLIEAGADVNAKEFRGVTPMAMAAGLGHTQVLEAMLSSQSANVNVQVSTKKNCEEDLISLSLSLCVCVCVCLQEDNAGSTPLHRAMDVYERSCVRKLLEHGANPSLCDFKLNTPLHKAVLLRFMG